ncbi:MULTISPECIES: TauD/TfdA family dioxygenase [Deefgea]|uniref:TauD/TfdA-like domain-containing protein n=1 Tax=Deefgea chitinilytica TaxID=570276 RepID=A0ABS2CFX7_9NEIS|nr:MULTISPECIES: TauD/TfdA family dioxygenase [Deefgea]MBM5572997.1 hypothetical protein [Deefgea chitinilytica]MBM9890233.1 TauD/TfdA family dioxygenase [Deefgea sp. CFH1-16]
MINSLNNQEPKQTDIVELRLSWVTAMAWQTLLLNNQVAENCFSSKMPYLGEQAKEILPIPIVEALQEFRENPNQSVLILRNCPIDRILPPTPYSGKLSPAQSPISCLVNSSLYQLMGIEPIVYEGENDGNLFRHVVPARSAVFSKSSHGSRARFGYHVDNPDLALTSEPLGNLSACPEYLSLFGMRCDPNVSTTLVLTRQILEKLPENVIDILASPRFTICRPASFGSAKKTMGLPLIAKGNKGQWLSRFDTENTYAEDQEADKALEILRSTLSSQEYDIKLLLLPGDFLIFKNQQILHARDAFTPLNDGVDRWLIRVFGIGDQSRVIPTSAARPFEVSA